MAKIHELKFELLGHPPFSPHLACSDFHLFPELKKFMRDKRFSSNEKLITGVEAYFADLLDSHFRDGLLEITLNNNKAAVSKRLKSRIYSKSYEIGRYLN